MEIIFFFNVPVCVLAKRILPSKLFQSCKSNDNRCTTTSLHNRFNLFNHDISRFSQQSATVPNMEALKLSRVPINDNDISKFATMTTGTV